MDLGTRIERLKEKEMRKVEQAASQGDVAALVSHTRRVEKLDSLETQYKEIERTVNAIQNGSNADACSPTLREMSAKAKGDIRREEFVDAIQKQGYEINHYKKHVLYTIAPDKIIGIAYASEVQPNKWWLGLPVENYHAFVLLCENEQGLVNRFIFPKTFYNEHRSKFSRDQDGKQLKFNIMLQNGRYALKIPSHRDIYINIYLDKLEHLQ